MLTSRRMGAAVLALGVLAVGCGSDDDSGDSAPADGTNAAHAAEPDTTGGGETSGEEMTIGVAVFQFSNTYLTLVRNAIEAQAEEEGVDGRRRRRPERAADPERADRPVHLQGLRGHGGQPGRPRAGQRDPRQGARGATSRSSSSTRSPSRGPRHGRQVLLRRRRRRGVRDHAGRDRRRLLERQSRRRQQRRRDDAVRDAPGPGRPPGRPAPHRVLGQGARGRRHRDRGGRARDRRLEPSGRPGGHERDPRRARRRDRVRHRQQRRHGARRHRGAPRQRLLRDDGKFMPVVGVDATAPALEALEDGTLLGNGAQRRRQPGQGHAQARQRRSPTARPPTEENAGYPITDGKYVWVPYQKILKENIDDAE